MDEHPAELLPGLYREVLDAVAVLELAGHRAAAGRIREDATRAYSSAWNHVAARRLRRLRDDARRLAGTRQLSRSIRSWRLPRRRPTEHRPA